MKFRFVKCSTNSVEEVLLCNECSFYLTENNTKEATQYKYMWPSFMWSLLNDENIHAVYGSEAWKFIPKQWRVWWIHAIDDILAFQNVTIESPVSYVDDITTTIKSMKKDINSNHLGKLADTCNKHLMPLVLCPWGECEYIHTCGHCYLDVMIQRHLPACYITTINDHKK